MINQLRNLLAVGLTLGALTGFALPARGASSQANPALTSKPAERISELFGDTVVARGKGLEIKRSQVDTAIIAIKATAAARGQTIPPEMTRSLEQQVLSDLIGQGLILTKATAAEKAKGQEEFNKFFAKFKADSKLSDAEFEDKLTPQLRAQGLTREQWEKQRVDQIIVGLVLERELNVTISDEDAKKYYEEYPARFEKPESVRASHILFSTRNQATGTELSAEKKQEKRKLAEDILKRARNGEDFAKLAQEYSEDLGSKDRGGEYTFPRGQMVPEFESAAFSLKPDQISDIVTTQFGYHIIKLSEKIPAHKVELASVLPEVKEGLKQQAIQKQLKDYVTKLRQDAAVEILDERLKPKDDNGSQNK